MEQLKSYLSTGLLRHARLLEAMTKTLRSHLPAEVAAHCWVGGVRGRMLVVVTDSASFAVAAHYRQHEILARINNDFKAELREPLGEFKTRVSPLPAAAKMPRKRPELSSDSARGLACAAESVTDPELKAALTRLAQRGGKPRF